VLAVCGGGSDAVATIVVVLVAGLYAAALLAALTRVEDTREATWLSALLLVSIVIGGAFFLYPDGVSGNYDYLGRFVVSMVVSGILAALLLTQLEGRAIGRTFVIALAGTALVPGSLLLLFFSSLIFGTGCLD
jgi:hypothetical protein